MIEDEIGRLANLFLLKELGRPLKLVGIRRSEKRPLEWGVIYETIDSTGKLLDGPTVVIVDEGDKSARFFE